MRIIYKDIKKVNAIFLISGIFLKITNGRKRHQKSQLYSFFCYRSFAVCYLSNFHKIIFYPLRYFFSNCVRSQCLRYSVCAGEDELYIIASYIFLPRLRIEPSSHSSSKNSLPVSIRYRFEYFDKHIAIYSLTWIKDFMAQACTFWTSNMF